MQKRGRPLATSVRIYKYGFVRLPASFNPQQRKIQVRWSGKTLSFSVASNGEIAYTPIFSNGSKSAVISLHRVLRLMNVPLEQATGEYKPTVRQGTLSIKLR